MNFTTLKQLTLCLESDAMSYRESVGSDESLYKFLDDYTDSLYMSQGSDSASSVLASSEGPFYSDVETRLNDYQDVLKAASFGTRTSVASDRYSNRAPEKDTGPRAGLYGLDTSSLPFTKLAISPGITDDAIQELPAESLAHLYSQHTEGQSHSEILGSSSPYTLPGADYFKARNLYLPGPPVTPLSPDRPSPLVVKAPWPTGMPTRYSPEISKIQVNNFLEQRVELCSSRKVQFASNRKRADYVCLAQGNTCAAFVFSDQVQLCRDIGDQKTQVTLKQEKKSGRYITACLSNTHLAAISESPSVNVRPFNQDVHPLCLAISPKSDIIAVGQRIKAGSSRGASRYHAAIQLYSANLVPVSLLPCQTARDNEFPKHISFYDDGQAMLYSNNKTFGLWKCGASGWIEIPLGSFEAKVAPA